MCVPTSRLGSAHHAGPTARSPTSLVRARADVVCGSGPLRTGLRRHHAAVAQVRTTHRRTSVLAGVCRAEGRGLRHRHRPRRRESLAAGRAAAMPLVMRGVATRQLAEATEVTEGGRSRRRRAREAGGGVASQRRVAVSRAPRAAGRATSVVRAVGSLVAMRSGMAVVTRQAVSRVVARRRGIADSRTSVAGSRTSVAGSGRGVAGSGRRRRGTVLTQAEVRWLYDGLLLPGSPLGCRAWLTEGLSLGWALVGFADLSKGRW